jgi:hypothetical protein
MMRAAPFCYNRIKLTIPIFGNKTVNTGDLFGDALELLEEFRRGVDVTSFGLNGLDDHTGHKSAGFVETFKFLFHFGQAFAILGFIFFGEFFQRVLVPRETGDRPIQRGKIQFENRSRMRSGEAT